MITETSNSRLPRGQHHLPDEFDPQTTVSWILGYVAGRPYVDCTMTSHRLSREVSLRLTLDQTAQTFDLTDAVGTLSLVEETESLVLRAHVQSSVEPNFFFGPAELARFTLEPENEGSSRQPDETNYPHNGDESPAVTPRWSVPSDNSLSVLTPPSSNHDQGILITHDGPVRETMRFLSVECDFETTHQGDVITRDRPDELPLYRALAAAREARAPLQTMADIAHKHLSDHPRVSNPIRLTGDLVQQIGTVGGHVSWQELEFMVATTLKESAANFFDQHEHALNKEPWDQLMALAYATKAQQVDDPRLTKLSVDALRGLMFLRCLLDVAGTPPCDLTRPPVREWVLRRIPIALPNLAAPPPIAVFGEAKHPDAWAEVLGIGHVRAVVEQWLGAKPGKLARVINVMPREQLTRNARSRERSDTGETDTTLSHHHHRGQDAHATNVETLSGIHDAAIKDCSSEDFRKLNVNYGEDGLTLILDGSIAAQEGRQSRKANMDVRRVEGWVKQAQRSHSSLVARHRAERLRFEWEQSTQQEWDNRACEQPLVGVMRWVDNVYQFNLTTLGRRLIVEVLIANPARAYKAERRRHYGPLHKPKSLPALGIESPQDLNRTNAAVAAAHYDVTDLTEYPRHELRFSVQLGSTGAKTADQIHLPVGYEIVATVVTTPPETDIEDVAQPKTQTKPTLRYTVGNDDAWLSYAVMGIAGVETGGINTPLSLEQDGEAQPAPFTHHINSVPRQGCVKLTDLVGLKGPLTIPISVQSNADYYTAIIAFVATLKEPTPRKAVWQIKTYRQLSEGYERVLREYERARDECYDINSQEAPLEVLRRQLKSVCLNLLEGAPSSKEPTFSELRQTHDSPHEQPRLGPLGLRRMSEALAWREMTFAFYPWPIGEPKPEYHWRGQNVVDWEGRDLFHQFLVAESARLLLPVTSGYERMVLSYLQWRTYREPIAHYVPLTERDTALLAQLSENDDDVRPCEEQRWRVEIPSTELILDANGELPWHGGSGEDVPCHHQAPPKCDDV